MSTYVGISGWKYKDWRGTFYPPKLPQCHELFFASHTLPSIEINGTFYFLQRPSTYTHWFEETPDHFVFSVKANRYITHIKKINHPLVPMANFFASGILNLENKLGPILWQFPQGMAFNPDKFEKFLDLLPTTTFEAVMLAKKTKLSKDRCSFLAGPNRKLRHAIEIRNESFLNPLFLNQLKDHNVALVFADTAGKWPYMEDITSDFLYIRLHGDSELYVSGYDDSTLNFWAKRIIKWTHGKEPKDKLTLMDDKISHKNHDAFIYFDNDAKVRAPVDAQNLISKLNLLH